MPPFRLYLDNGRVRMDGTMANNNDIVIAELLHENEDDDYDSVEVMSIVPHNQSDIEIWETVMDAAELSRLQTQAIVDQRNAIAKWNATLTNGDDVEVTAVVQPTSEPEGWVVDGPCPICLEEIHDGDKVVILSCGGGHFVCEGCYDKHTAMDRDHIKDTYANTLWEAVRRAEGADKCPVCRQMSHCATIVAAKRTGRTNEDAIEID